MKKLLDSDRKIRLIELFGGIGTQAMALERMGVDFEHYRLVEFDKYPVASYNAIHGTDFKPLDISEIHIDDLGIKKRDKYQYIVTFSFPCQDLSQAGHMAGMDEGSGTRSSLLWEVGRILREGYEKGRNHGDTALYLPDVLVMENVTQVHSRKNIKNFEKWLNVLSSLGYTTKYADMNAKDFGVPQNRSRTFAVSWLDKDRDFIFPEPIPLEVSMKDCLEPEDEVDEKFYIRNERSEKLINELKEKYGEHIDEIL